MKRAFKIIGIIDVVILWLIWIYLMITPFKTQASERFVGCAIDLCPKGIQEWHFKNGGMWGCASYVKDSKEYWRCYCNGALDWPDSLNYLKCN